MDVFYTAGNNRQFQKETGIKVNLSYYDNNDVMLAKLMSGAKGFDIVSPSTDYVDVLRKKWAYRKNWIRRNWEKLLTTLIRMDLSLRNFQKYTIQA